MSVPLNGHSVDTSPTLAEIEAYARQIFAANVAFWFAICRPSLQLRTRKQWLFDTTALPRIMYQP